MYPPRDREAEPAETAPEEEVMNPEAVVPEAEMATEGMVTAPKKQSDDRSAGCRERRLPAGIGC